MSKSTFDLIYNEDVDYATQYLSDWDWKSVCFEDLKGKVIKEIQLIKDKEGYGDAIFFIIKNSYDYKMYHRQECCEHVYIESIDGDLNDLLDSEILVAEEITEEFESEWGEGAWTFYKLVTDKGYVTIRWNGESNGYYSVEADFKRRSV